jgi:hypothetical protein
MQLDYGNPRRARLSKKITATEEHGKKRSFYRYTKHSGLPCKLHQTNHFDSAKAFPFRVFPWIPWPITCFRDAERLTKRLLFVAQSTAAYLVAASNQPL